MLTPTGLGKEFRVTGKPYRPRKPRHRTRRRIVVLVCVLAVLGGGGYSAYRFGPFHSDAAAAACPTPTATPTAAVHPVAAAQPNTVIVHVLNATKNPGLAGRTATALQQRGFTQVSAANANPSDDGNVHGTAVIRSGPAGLAAQRLLLAEVNGAVAETDTRPDASVDLILGDAFTGLRDPAAANAALVATSPKPTATPTHRTCR